MSRVQAHDPERRRALLVMGGAATLPWLGCGGSVAAPRAEGDASAEDGAIDTTMDAPTTPPEVGTTMDSGTVEDASTADVDASLLTDGCAPTGNVAVVAFALYPGLDGEAGYARLMVQCYTDPICLQNLIIVVRTAQGDYLAFSDSCTHACCELNFTGSELVCPCCHSVFNLQGLVMSGPAPQPLPVLATRWDEDAVYVTL